MTPWLHTLILILLFSWFAAHGDTLVVTNLADSGPGTLRDTIMSANPGDTIIFTNTLAGQTVALTSGVIELYADLNIDASALSVPVRIAADGSARVFYVYPSTTVILNSLVVLNGGGEAGSGDGAGIFNGGRLTLKNSEVANNRLSPNVNNFRGGGLANDYGGTLILNNTTVDNNWVAGMGEGGGIVNYGLMTMTNSTVAANSASNFAGGIENFGMFTVNNSTFTGNYAFQCGAFFSLNGTNFFYNTTVASNSAAIAGALGAQAELTLVNCTVSGNSASQNNGGMYNSGNLYLTNSIISGNTSADFMNYGTFHPGATNLVGVANILLAPLGKYGGATQTMPPLPGSPAIDAGDNSVTNRLATDQRGCVRLFGARVDIGAVESIQASSWAVGNGDWNFTAFNWQDSASRPLLYSIGQTAQFDDTASGASPVFVTNRLSITNGSIVISNSTKDYVFIAGSGFISNNVPITKAGAGTVTIGSANANYAGHFILAGGTLALPLNSSLGSAGTGALLIMSNNTAIALGSSGGFVPLLPVLIGAGANVNVTANAINTGFGGNVSSADSAALINDNSSVTYGANFLGFTGTLKVNSGTTLFSKGANGATDLGSSNAVFIVNGSLRPNRQSTIVHLGALSGTGTLAGSQTTSSTNTTTYWIGKLNTSTTFGGTFVDNNSPNTNVAIVKLGTGTLTLTNNSANTGSTTVSNGTLLLVTGGSLSNSPLTIANGATNGVTIATAGGSCMVTNLTYAIGGTECVVFDLGNHVPTASVAPLQVRNDLAINGTLRVMVAGSSSNNFPRGTYPLISYSGALTGTAPTLPFALPTSVEGYLTNLATTKSLALVVTNGPVTYAGTPPLLRGAMVASDGSFKFNFTNTPGATLTVWSTTNLTSPFNQWSNLGAPAESPAGTFIFTDLPATNDTRRFYRVTSP
jgi:autotransporter-associated beta strand protein